jgi:hypothetical protein
MANKNVELHIRFIERPKAMLKITFVESVKKDIQIAHTENIFLESYQLDNGNPKDEKVIADKIANIAKENEFKIKGSIHFVIETPRIITYSAIMPKTLLKKAKTMAIKELDEVMIKNSEYYSKMIRVFDAKEKGVIVHIDLIPLDLVNVLVTLGDHLDRLIESVVKASHCLYPFYQELYMEEENLMIVYTDKETSYVALVINGKYVDSISLHEPYDDSDLFSLKLAKNIRLLAGKHQFAYEKEIVKHVLVVSPLIAVKTKLEKVLEDELSLAPINIENLSHENVFYAVLQNSHYMDFTFDIKG